MENEIINNEEVIVDVDTTVAPIEEVVEAPVAEAVVEEVSELVSEEVL